MRVLHICLAAFYIDGYSYQENILPREHKKMGNTVKIIASTETFINNNKAGYVEPKRYFNEDNIEVIRIPYKKTINNLITRKIRKYEGLYIEIDNFKPDIIFIHDTQFYDIKEIIKYLKNNKNVEVFADCHSDFLNSARSWVSKNILHRLFYKRWTRKILPYIQKIYGVVPARVDFLINFYKVPKEKVDLLLMGAEEEKVIKAIKNKKYQSLDHKLRIVTGGKIDNNKPEIINLMKAVNQLDEDIELLVFGSVSDELNEKFNIEITGKVKYIGWKKSDDLYQVFQECDLIVFPGLHSVLWEQAVGSGVPCLFRKIDGFTHVDIGGNCDFLNSVDSEQIKKQIKELFYNREKLSSMRKVALEKGISAFSYSNIAKKSIEIKGG